VDGLCPILRPFGKRLPHAFHPAGRNRELDRPPRIKTGGKIHEHISPGFSKILRYLSSHPRAEHDRFIPSPGSAGQHLSLGVKTEMTIKSKAEPPANHDYLVIPTDKFIMTCSDI